MAWTEQMVEDLRKMWKEGLTTGEIGKRLNVSKNSIVGKVHRLGLSGRPSPIKKKSDVETPLETVKETTNPALDKAEKKTVEPAKVAAPAKAQAPKSVEADKKASAPAPKDFEPRFSSRDHEKKNNGCVSLTDLDSHTCRWPIGDPKDENFHFCGKKIKIGQTYCDEHSAVAYVKPAKK